MTPRNKLISPLL